MKISKSGSLDLVENAASRCFLGDAPSLKVVPFKKS